MKSTDSYEEIQKFLNSISKLLRVDILMVDVDCRKVAGTGTYEQASDKQNYNDSFFGRCLSRKNTVLLYDGSLLNREEIDYKFEEMNGIISLYHPILTNDKIKYIVKFEITDIHAKKKFIEETESITLLIDQILTCFLKKQGLISYDLEESSIETLINFTREPVIYMTPTGRILKINDHAKTAFKLSDNDKDKPLHDIFNNINFGEFSENESSMQRESFNVLIDNYKVTGNYETQAVWASHEIAGIFVRFEIDKKMDAYGDEISNRITFDDIVGTSRAIVKAKDYAFKVLKGTSTVFINGESGTGKELFARAIHNASSRGDAPFIPINCAAIPDTLMESELFGYEEGSFTGAKKGGKPGKFELANHGTIFLDEIGDMKLSLQAKLLRVLQENVIERIGSKKSIPIDVRVIAATHEEIHEKIEDGTFRQDLFYRLSVIPIRIPPLRDRSSDIMIIAEKFLERYTKKMSKSILGFDDVVTDKLNSYVWPGNVRELENVIEFAVNMAMSDIIHIDDLPARFYDSTHRNKELFGQNSMVKITPIHDLEANEIKKAIEVYGHSKKGIIEASKALGMSVATLYRRLRTMN